MTDYQKRSDISTVPALVALAETEARKFLSFNHATEREDGAIPRKYRGTDRDRRRAHNPMRLLP